MGKQPPRLVGRGLPGADGIPLGCTQQGLRAGFAVGGQGRRLRGARFGLRRRDVEQRGGLRADLGQVLLGLLTSLLDDLGGLSLRAGAELGHRLLRPGGVGRCGGQLLLGGGLGLSRQLFAFGLGRSGGGGKFVVPRLAFRGQLFAGGGELFGEGCALGGVVLLEAGAQASDLQVDRGAASGLFDVELPEPVGGEGLRLGDPDVRALVGCGLVLVGGGSGLLGVGLRFGDQLGGLRPGLLHQLIGVALRRGGEQGGLLTRLGHQRHGVLPGLLQAVSGLGQREVELAAPVGELALQLIPLAAQLLGLRTQPAHLGVRLGQQPVGENLGLSNHRRGVLGRLTGDRRHA